MSIFFFILDFNTESYHLFQGAHLPVGPPIPPAIARAVEYLLRVNPQQQQPQQQYYKRF